MYTLGQDSTDLPFRPPSIRSNSKQLARAQQIRNLARRRNAHGSNSFAVDDMFSNSLVRDRDRDRDIWGRRDHLDTRRDLLSARQASLLAPSRFEKLDDDDTSIFAPRSSLAPISSLYLPRSLSSSDLSYRNAYGKSLKPWGRIEYEGEEHLPYGSECLPFDKAAARLNTALDRAIRFTNALARSFDDDTCRLAAYAEPKVLAYLWAAKLDWDGVDVRDKKKNPHLEADPATLTFRSTMRRLLEAIEEVKVCGPPSARIAREESEKGGKLGPQEVKTILRKLHVSYQAIAELMEGVRAERERLVGLNRELIEAQKLLMDLGDLWSVRQGEENNASSSSGDGRIRVDEFKDWPNYRGE